MDKTNIPREITFAGIDWKIELAHESNLDDRPKLGKANFSKHLITINANASSACMEETLLHELIHIALYQTGLADSLNIDNEEQLVRSLSLNMYGILKQNNFLNFDNQSIVK